MDFFKLSQQLFNNELLASEGAVRDVLAKYDAAMKHGPEYVGLVKKTTFATEMTSVIKGTDGSRIGILPVKGSLVYEETNYEAMCGMTSYEGLVAKAEKMILELGADQLILDINSGGGMAYGCFESAQRVKSLADEHGVKITAYVDGVAFSGGYAWCCIADEVIVNPMGKVGSIGVVLPLVNRSEQDKKEGIERIYITAGKSKVPFDKDGKFTKEALADIKDSVMETYDMFVNHVADMRGMDRNDVIDTEAKTFGTKEALKLGLIDKVMTKEQFYEHLGNFNGDSSMSVMTSASKTKEKVEGNDSPVHLALTGQITSLQGEVTNLETQVTTLTGQISTLTGEKAQLVTELATANTRIQELETEAAKIKQDAVNATLDARKAKIAALVSVDDVEEHLGFVENFDDEKFEKYISRLEKSNEKIEEGFEEQGQGDGDDSAQIVDVSQKMVQRIRDRKKGK